MKLRKEFIIGVLASFTLVAFYWGFSYLKGNDLFSDESEFELVYEKVAGLTESNPVTLNGVKIGSVSLVEFITNDPNARVRVKIKVSDPKVKIPDQSLAIIKSDLLGVNSIEIQLRPSKRFAESGDTLATSVATTIQEEVSMQMLPIKAKAEEMMASIDSVLNAIKYIFNSETQLRLAATFKSIQLTIENLESSSVGLDTLIKTQGKRVARIFSNVESITANLEKSNQQISNIIGNFSNLSDSLTKINIASTIANLDESIRDFKIVMDKIERGEGTLGQLVNNDTLYNELEAASRELHILLEDIKLNPKRYVRVSVFGGKNNDSYVVPSDAKKP
jgi:phospholipid/cholesterol/gamma-HCH transport system substrate-binding protein